MNEPVSRLEKGFAANLRYDAPAGLVVFLVALPLCLGIALASEAPLMSGIIAGVVGGLVVAALSSSALSVSGPAAGLAVIVAQGIHTLGSFEVFLAAVVVGGVLQILLGLARLGFLATLFPHSVIKGMLAAIGIILILKQIPHALGRDADFEGDLAFSTPGGETNTFTEIIQAIYTWSPGVVVVTGLSLAVLLLWERPVIKQQAWSRLVPGPLVAVVLGVVINEIYAVALPAWYISAADGHMVSLPVFNSADAFLSGLRRPDFSRILDPQVLTIGATLAAIASIETLLSVEAVDKLDPFRRSTPMNRELLAQGVGNTVSGLIGGLPITAVIVRSSANVYAGGRTKMSAIIHGALLASLVLSVPLLLNRIPLATLAAILLMVGYKLARVELFQKMWADGLDQFLPFIVTIIVTVMSDLLIGVAVGFTLGSVMVLLTNHHSSILVVNEGNDYLIKLTKDVSFLNKPALRNTLASIPDGSHVILDGSRAMFVDHDIREVLEDFRLGAPQRDITLTSKDLDSRPFPLMIAR